MRRILINSEWHDVFFSKEPSPSERKQLKRDEDRLFDTAIGQILLRAAGYFDLSPKEMEEKKIMDAKKHMGVL